MNVIISILESIAPTFPSVATERAKPPYILYTESESPIRTFDGIAGMEITLEITVVETSKAAAQKLKSIIISLLDGNTFRNRTLYYDNARYVDYPDEGLSSYEIVFRIES